MADHDDVASALDAFRKGSFVLVYDADGREEETDFFVPAQAVSHEHVRTMRREGGGLIFLMAHHDVCERLGLPFMTSIYDAARGNFPVLDALVPNDIPYDSKSSFSLAINHRKTFTGITDIDRALTMREFGRLAERSRDAAPGEGVRLLGESFRSPGHVPICRSSPNPLKDRFGHTELAVALALMAGISPVVAGCEIMDASGRAKPRKMTMAYARENGHPFLEGKDIIGRFRDWSA